MSSISMGDKTTISESSGNLVYNNGYLIPSRKYLNVTHFYNTTRTTLSNSSYSTLWSFTINKLYDENTSNLQLYCLLPGHENWSDVCGIHVHIQNSTSLSTDGIAQTSDLNFPQSALYNLSDNNKFLVEENTKLRIFDMSSAYHDIWYIGANATNETFAISSISKEFSELSAGTHTVNFGWQTRDGGSGNKPFNTWNPNSAFDARNHQSRSNLIINEIKT